MNIQEFQQTLVQDCLIDLENSLGKDMRPFSMHQLFSNTSEFLKIQFPEATDEIARLDQYQLLSHLYAATSHGRVGLVSFVALTAEAHATIDTKLWGRECHAALIGSVSLHTVIDDTNYQTSLIIFDEVDGEFVYSQIDDVEQWQDFIDNVSVFRDVLYLASIDNKTIYNWNDIFSLMRTLGFEFDFSNELAQTIYILDQPAHYV